MVGKPAIKPDSSDGGAVFRRKAAFWGLGLIFWGSCTNPISAVLPKYWELCGLDPSLLCPLPPFLFISSRTWWSRLNEHVIAWCLHVSLTSLLVAADKSAPLIAEVLVTLSKNGSSFDTHHGTSLRRFAFPPKFLQSVSLSLSPVPLAPPIVLAWIDPSTMFLA